VTISIFFHMHVPPTQFRISSPLKPEQMYVGHAKSLRGASTAQTGTTAENPQLFFWCWGQCEDTAAEISIWFLTVSLPIDKMGFGSPESLRGIQQRQLLSAAPEPYLLPNC
jgi:hypothetical protein